VEVPILVDNTGLHPCCVGDLPPQLAAVNRTNVNVHELAAEGFLQRDRAAVFQACAVDPLTAASVAIDDIRRMVDELFAANARWLDRYEAAGARLGAAG
jgi:alpha-galactosidase